MNILTYLDPWIELKYPTWRKPWIIGYSGFLVQWNNHLGIKTKLICSDAYKETLSIRDGLDIKFITIEEISNICNGYKQFHTDILGDKKIFNKMQKLIKSKTANFKPDIVITTTENEFLKKIFPNSLTLLLEVGIFSQAPYLPSIYFDTELNISKSYIKRYKQKLLNKTLSKKEAKLLTNIREKYLDIFQDNKNPFKHKCHNLKKKFSRTIILALQPSNIAMTFKHCSFESQFDYMMYILNNLDSNVGIIVTEHRLEKILNPDLIEYLKNNYSNFIYFDDLDNYENSSQLLLPFIDGVITTASTVGWQAVFYQKYLFVLGDAHISAFSDADNINDINKCLVNTNSPKNKDGALYELLTKYWIPLEYIYSKNSEWIFNFFNNSLKKHRNNKIDNNFYELIDDPEVIFQKMMNHKYHNIYKKKGESSPNDKPISHSKKVSRMDKPLKRKDVPIIFSIILIFYLIVKML
jgi:hypothetical protein